VRDNLQLRNPVRAVLRHPASEMCGQKTEREMERNVVSLTHSSNPPEQTPRDFDGYLTHQHPFPYNVVRESPPAAYKARIRKGRKAAKAQASDRRIGPKGWKDDLQMLIKKHNWRHATKPKAFLARPRMNERRFCTRP
jgi:hypothetical protein